MALPFLLVGVGLVQVSGTELGVLFEYLTADEFVGAARDGEVLVPGLIGLAILSFVLSVLVPATYVETRLANYVWSEPTSARIASPLISHSAASCGSGLPTWPPLSSVSAS